MRARRRAAAGETDLVERLRADLAEVEDIAGNEMRLYLTDLALERARLALDVPAAFASAQAARAGRNAPHPVLLPRQLALASWHLNVAASASGCGGRRTLNCPQRKF